MGDVILEVKECFLGKIERIPTLGCNRPNGWDGQRTGNTHTMEGLANKEVRSSSPAIPGSSTHPPQDNGNPIEGTNERCTNHKFMRSLHPFFLCSDPISNERLLDDGIIIMPRRTSEE